MTKQQIVYEEVGRRLRLGRQMAGLTQEEMAEKLGMTLGGYNGYETAKRRIPLCQLKGAAAILGQPLPYFLGEQISPDDLAAWQFYGSLPEQEKATVRAMIAFLQARSLKAIEAA